jgi:hypothetical protein
MREALEAVARARRAQELDLVRRVERLALLVGRKLLLAPGALPQARRQE